MSCSRAARQSALLRTASRGITGHLPLTLALAVALPACKPTVIGCEEDSGGASVTDGSFEEQPTPWALAPHSTIDEQQGVCGSKRSLRVELDQGLGSAETTRSAPLAGLQPGKEYEVAFHYRFDHCAAATLTVDIGSYKHQLHFDGSNGTWGDTSIVVQAGSEPTSIAIHPERTGDPADYATADFDDNLMWVDDFTIHAL